MASESLRNTHCASQLTVEKDVAMLSWLPICLIGLGILLLFIEIILLPGFGAAGVPGIALICVGVGTVWFQSGWETALIYALGVVAVTIPISILGLWLAPRTKLGKSLILDNTESSTDGFQAPSPDLVNLIGKSGKAITPLRPTGAALINGRRVDVVSLGEFIEAETEVEVMVVEGNRVVVRNL